MVEQSNLFDPIEYAKHCIEEQVGRLMPKEILYATVDMKKLVQITSHSGSYLEREFVVIPEAKALECSPTTKRLWRYPEIRECWLEFCVQNNVKTKEESK